MPRKRLPAFPELEKQILASGIRKTDIAAGLQISNHAFSRKLTGLSEFTLHEVEQIASLFPNVRWEKLFERAK